MKKRVLALLMVLALVAGVFAGCGGNDQSSQGGSNDNSTPVSTPANEGDDTSEPEVSTTAGPADTSELYSFTTYYNYTGWNKQFGLDEASAYLCNKFNIEMNWYGPDSDPDAKLNLMVSSDDLPESVIMDRSPLWIKLCKAGVFQDLQQYMYPGNTYEQDVAEGTREMLKVEGGLYGVPNWSRKGATGGNYQWQVLTSAWEAAGSPDLQTLEDLHQYALKVKELGLSSYTGQSVLPFWCTNTDNGFYVYQPFYRATGNPNIIMNYYTQENGVIEYCLESEDFVKALKEANKWYNEGLFTAEVFTDNGDQFLEKITNGRPALMWYDFSQDSVNRYRQIVMEGTNGEESYEVLGHKLGKLPNSPQFPVMDGVEFAYGDETGGVGWNMNCVTTKATDPQRIFDLWTYMITPEFSAIMQYGPEGGTMLDHLEWGDDGLPIPVLKDGKAESDFTEAEKTAAGAWAWSQPAQSDYVDGIKYALNRTLPDDKKDWTIDIQDTLCTYNAENPQIGQKFMTDENTALDADIDQQSDLGVAKQSLDDQSKAVLPSIIMAASDAEFDQLVADLLNFAKTNGMVDELKAVFQAKHDANVAAQGYSAYSAEYDVYKLH